MAVSQNRLSAGRGEQSLDLGSRSPVRTRASDRLALVGNEVIEPL